jgi:hypothetical protein
MMRAKTALIALLVIGVVFAGTPTTARSPRKAKVRYELEDENHHVGGSGFGAGAWNTDDAYVFKLRKGERYISIDVQDDTERNVGGRIVQFVWDFEGGGASAGHAETSVPFCGETKKPVKLVPDIQVEILLQKGTCEDGTTQSLPERGWIYAKISRGR